MLKQLSLLCLGATAFTGAASANSDFCNGATKCMYINVANRSAALVTSVKVTQEKTDGACSYDERNFSQNLNGAGGENMDGDSFRLKVSTTCKYKIKFKTTNGCTGDKTTHLTPKKFAEGQGYAELKYGCGTLNARTG